MRRLCSNRRRKGGPCSCGTIPSFSPSVLGLLALVLPSLHSSLPFEVDVSQIITLFISIFFIKFPLEDYSQNMKTHNFNGDGQRIQMEAEGTFLINFGAHVNILFIIKVKILMLIEIGNQIRHVYLIVQSSNEHHIKTNARPFKFLQSPRASHTKMEKNHQDQSEVKGKTYMRYACLVWFLVRIKHLYFLVVYMYLGMAPGTYTKRTCVQKRLDYMLRN